MIGSVVRDIDGTVRITDVEFDPSSPFHAQLATELFGTYFARSMEQGNLSIRVTRDSLVGQRKWKVEFLPDDGYLIKIVDGASELVIMEGLS